MLVGRPYGGFAEDHRRDADADNYGLDHPRAPEDRASAVNTGVNHPHAPEEDSQAAAHLAQRQARIEMLRFAFVMAMIQVVLELLRETWEGITWKVTPVVILFSPAMVGPFMRPVFESLLAAADADYTEVTSQVVLLGMTAFILINLFCDDCSHSWWHAGIVHILMMVSVTPMLTYWRTHMALCGLESFVIAGTIIWKVALHGLTSSCAGTVTQDADAAIYWSTFLFNSLSPVVCAITVRIRMSIYQRRFATRIDVRVAEAEEPSTRTPLGELAGAHIGTVASVPDLIAVQAFLRRNSARRKDEAAWRTFLRQSTHSPESFWRATMAIDSVKAIIKSFLLKAPRKCSHRREKEIIRRVRAAYGDDGCRVSI